MKLYRYLVLTIALALVAAGIPATAGAALAVKLATYTHPDGLWSVQYPSDLLHPEQINPEVVIFISKERRRDARAWAAGVRAIERFALGLGVGGWERAL